LYSGIIATLSGLYASFNDANLSRLVESMLKQRVLNQDSFNQVVSGFTVAFGASAFGYLAFLASRFQQDIVDGYSADLALLIENDLSEAVTRAFAALAVEVPLMPPDVERALERLQETVTGAIGRQLEELAKVAQSVTQTSQVLVGRLEGAGQVWAGASERFADRAEGAARAIDNASSSIGGMATGVAAAATRLIEAATTITSELERGARAVNTTLEDGLNSILYQTNTHVGQFNATLADFRGHIEGQVADFHKAHEDVTTGRDQLHAAITLGHKNIGEISQQLRRTIEQMIAAEQELSASVQRVGGELQGQLLSMEDSLRSVEAGLRGQGRTVHDKLDEIIGLASGDRVDGQPAFPDRVLR
jgi:methyl-accepting chemotaxis protein